MNCFIARTKEVELGEHDPEFAHLPHLISLGKIQRQPRNRPRSGKIQQAVGSVFGKRNEVKLTANAFRLTRRDGGVLLPKKRTNEKKENASCHKSNRFWDHLRD